MPEIKELPLNARVRNCRNCAHCLRDGNLLWRNGLFDRCAKTGNYCRNEMDPEIQLVTRCGIPLRLWQPKPPRRSLRRWLMDRLWN